MLKSIGYLNKRKCGYIAIQKATFVFKTSEWHIRSKKVKHFDYEKHYYFLKEARDDKLLLVKVVLIFRLNGTCQRAELCSLNVKGIEETKNFLVIIIMILKPRRNVFTIRIYG